MVVMPYENITTYYAAFSKNPACSLLVDYRKIEHRKCAFGFSVGKLREFATPFGIIFFQSKSFSVVLLCFAAPPTVFREGFS